MIYEINNRNVETFINIINENINEQTQKEVRMVLYHTRTVHPYLKLILCTQKEWLSMYQFVVSSEYMKGNIDVICNLDIDKHTSSLILNELMARKEYLHERNAINTISLAYSNLDWL